MKLFGFIFGALLVAQASAKSFEKLPKFSVLSSRQASGAPEIHIQFPNGHQDSLALERADNREGSCNFIGHLKNSKEQSSAAVTGCLKGNADDKLSVTLLSPHFKGAHLFTVDAQGNVEAHESPFAKNKSRMVSQDSVAIKSRNVDAEDNGWKLAEGDDILNSEYEAAAAEAMASCTSADTCVLPSKMKVVMQFAYETSLKNKMASLNQDPVTWMHESLTHTKAHFKHATLTTQVEFEIIDKVLYHEATWTADNNINDARLVMMEKAEAGIDAMIWFMDDPAYWGTIGIAYGSALCSSGYKVNLNEWRQTTAEEGELIAHEVGHNFGMRHDFDHNDPSCIGIMDYTDNDPIWSTCNVADFKAAYISEGWANTCLEILDAGTPSPPSPPSPTPAPTPAPPPSCVNSWIGDGYCDTENNSEGCNYDGGDCCEPHSNSNWNYYCGNNCKCLSPATTTTTTTTTPPPPPANCNTGWIGDGYCDNENNVAGCQFDGGDCCAPHQSSNWNYYCGNQCECKN